MGAKKVPVVKGVRLRRKEHVNKSEDVHSINTKSDKIVGESQISPKVNQIKCPYNMVLLEQVNILFMILFYN